MIDFIDKTSGASGTPLNRKNFMALQGFQKSTTTFKEDGTIEETFDDGSKHTISFEQDGSITEVFQGQKKITKTTKFNDDKIEVSIT